MRALVSKNEPDQMFFRDILSAQAYEFLRRISGKRPLTENLFKGLDTSKTLYILGSACSINNLTAEDWARIKENTSFGFNMFFLHPFVPDFYFYETAKNQAYYDAFRLGIDQKRDQYKRVPFIVQFPHYFQAGHKKKLPDWMDLYYHVPFRNKALNSAQFRDQLNHKLFPQIGIDQLMHHGASLIYLILLGWKIGFKQIELVGVDLNGSPYFYEPYAEYDPLVKAMLEAKIIDASKNGVHNTANPKMTATYNELAVTETIPILKDAFFNADGVKLSVTNRESLLSPIV